MEADSFYAMGSSHDVCQDYALAGKDKQGFDSITFAIVSDGCSSSDNTDVGSRLVSWSVKNQISDTWIDGSIISPVATILSAEDTRWNLGYHELGDESLDATAVSAYEETINYKKTGKICVNVVGDGVVSARKKDGTVEIWVIEFNNNVPAYSSYLLSHDRFSALIESHGERTVQYKSGDNSFEILEVSKISLPESSNKFCHSRWSIENYSFNLLFDESYELIMVMSDGAQSFQRKDDQGFLESVPVQEVVDQMMNIKGFTGKFVERRARRFLNKFCRDNEWDHYDDFSVAAIYTGGKI